MPKYGPAFSFYLLNSSKAEDIQASNYSGEFKTIWCRASKSIFLVIEKAGEPFQSIISRDTAKLELLAKLFLVRDIFGMKDCVDTMVVIAFIPRVHITIAGYGFKV